MSKPNQRLMNDLFEVRLADGFDVEKKRTVAGDRFTVNFRGDPVTDAWPQEKMQKFLQQALWTRASQVIAAKTG
jgi:hypothetical protein